ncbi:MAG TPA: hypothetical protein VGJ20_28330 [Xanthobacteraceae bacterium]|jgi:hypothetical protein
MTLGETTAQRLIRYRDGLTCWLSEVPKIGELLHVNGAHWDAKMGNIT